MQTSNPCLEYTDEYGRKTDLIHVAHGATYPINILGNAATADVANNPLVDLQPESTDTISIRSGDQLDDGRNEYTHKITKVETAEKAISDAEGNVITETYATKDEAVTLDPETGKVRTDQLPDTSNAVNFINGKTGNVTLTAEDINFSAENDNSTYVEVENFKTQVESELQTKAPISSIPTAGRELYTENTSINAYAYSLSAGSGEVSLVKSDKDGEVSRSTAPLNALGIFNFAPANVFDTSVNLRVDINWEKVGSMYNMAYLTMLDRSAGTWTIRNLSKSRIYVMRFGGRVNSGARISPMPIGNYVDVNGSFTFYLDSDDPYLDRNSFGLLVWKLGDAA